MGKSTGLLLLCLYLTLQQLIVAHPLPSDITAQTAVDNTKVNTTNSSEANFIKALEPVIVATLDGVEKYFDTLQTETARFVDGVLKSLIALPEDNDYIRELTPRLTSLLARLKDTSLESRSALIRDIGDLYAEFDNIAERKDDDIKVDVLSKVLDKFQLLEMHFHVRNAVDNAVRRFSRAFEQFWASLSEAQQTEHRHLSDLYEHLKTSKTNEEKLKGIEEFLQMALEFA
ncbi:PREDICTED: uncharacterized protein LOC108966967 isoform X1 [Bactrocera latifrons]|uniref:uncharacterized protein LOC108966967 isoform X1 n=1 Tax=Bactrocera latifrons TaxID=174628 RepID=UPI0008DCCC7A|nr:PREDICTED: uncharacterized protein LOC108966967 isoform X1 [Bactrocera latifrons]